MKQPNLKLSFKINQPLQGFKTLEGVYIIECITSITQNVLYI